MLTRILLLLTLSLTINMFFVRSADATIITVNGSDYELSSATGIYNDLRPMLAANPWFSSADLATTFLDQILEQVMSFSSSTLFAFEDFSKIGIEQTGVGYYRRIGAEFKQFGAFNRQSFDPDYFTNDINTFALATKIDLPPNSVSSPPGYFLLLLGLLLILSTRMKSKERREKDTFKDYTFTC